MGHYGTRQSSSLTWQISSQPEMPVFLDQQLMPRSQHECLIMSYSFSGTQQGLRRNYFIRNWKSGKPKFLISPQGLESSFSIEEIAQILDWAKQIKKFESLGGQGEFLMSGGRAVYWTLANWEPQALTYTYHMSFPCPVCISQGSDREWSTWIL